MATFAALLEDKKTYPDDMKITMADGVETTVGELRSGHMKDADYRKKTTEVANERRRLESEKQEFLQAKTEAELQLKELAKEVISSRPVGTTVDRDELEAELKADPRTARLLSQLEETKKKLDEVNKRVETVEEARVREREAAMVRAHQQMLGILKQKDPELDQEALVEYARTYNIPRLDVAYQLMTEGDRMKKATEEAKQKGIEEGKKLASQPVLPQRRTVINPPADAPKTFDEAFARAEVDPEIQALMSGQE